MTPATPSTARFYWRVYAGDYLVPFSPQIPRWEGAGRELPGSLCVSHIHIPSLPIGLQGPWGLWPQLAETLLTGVKIRTALDMVWGCPKTHRSENDTGIQDPAPSRAPGLETSLTGGAWKLLLEIKSK